MPIVRKVLRVGNSRGITFPKTWIDYYENETGQELREVAIEVDCSLTISPIKNRKSSPDDVNKLLRVLPREKFGKRHAEQLDSRWAIDG